MSTLFAACFRVAQKSRLVLRLALRTRQETRPARPLSDPSTLRPYMPAADLWTVEITAELLAERGLLVLCLTLA